MPSPTLDVLYAPSCMTGLSGVIAIMSHYREINSQSLFTSSVPASGHLYTIPVLRCEYVTPGSISAKVLVKAKWISTDAIDFWRHIHHSATSAAVVATQVYNR